MAIKLQTLPATGTLADLQTTIIQQEALGFELITLARGLVSGAKSNTATFRNRAPGDAPGPLTLVEVSPELGLPDQQTAANNGETAGKLLISYGAVLLRGNETNVAAYRG